VLLLSGSGAVEHRGRGVPGQPAVAVLSGVTVHELRGPLSGVVDAVEPVGAEQVIFDRLEQGFGERVVIADPGPRERGLGVDRLQHIKQIS
jgi:hypothetical protein